MKKKLIENTPPVKTRKKGNAITVQVIEDIIVLNIYKDKVLRMRYCMSKETNEYAVLKFSDTMTGERKGMWHTEKLEHASGFRPRYSYGSMKTNRLCNLSQKDSDMICDLLDPSKNYYARYAFDIISQKEYSYGSNKRASATQRKYERINGLMELVPDIPNDFKDWIFETSKQNERFIKDTVTGEWRCSHCGEAFSEYEWSEKVRRKTAIKCPRCRTMGIVEKIRKGYIDHDTTAYLIQDMSKEYSVVRYFDIRISFTSDCKKTILLNEAFRIILGKNETVRKKHRYGGYDIYYNQFPKGGSRRYSYYGYCNEFTEATSWDYSNPGSRRVTRGYIYPKGAESLRETTKEGWERALQFLGGKTIDLNALLSVTTTKLANVCEFLAKGRFYNIVTETDIYCYAWDGAYRGPLNLDGCDIKEVFGISDQQLINRLRDNNGDYKTLEWLKWSDKAKKKISDKALKWIIRNRIPVKDTKWLLRRMSPEAAMNYIERQKNESYPTFSISAVIEQYEDYMSVVEATGKDMDDEMVYRPRELKRRHDELIATKEKLEIVKRMNEDPEKRREEAERMRERFPEAETILEEVSEKFTWQDEKYVVVVPKSLVEIMIEGNALHHCVGASDRYFDRIMQRETFICFLRKAEEPLIPYYTLEVEPGGTIRQHRGAYDEEPDIEEVKKSLKAWQKEIKRRMTKADKRLAKVSKQKREENIRELQEQGNTRVLNGLMEDFMEAI